MSAEGQRSWWIFLRPVGRCIQQAKSAERKSPARENPADIGGCGGGLRQIRRANKAAKKQGRRRSMTLTALPAPGIEIRLRRPANLKFARKRLCKLATLLNVQKNIH